METAGQDLDVKVLSAIDGLLTGISISGGVELANAERSNTNFLVPQSLQSWRRMSDTRKLLDGHWSRMMDALPTLGPMDIDDTLASFTDPTKFSQAAVLSFRNTLTGHPPRSLGDILALCTLSLTTSDLSNAGSLAIDTVPCLNHWRNAIYNHVHRQAFTYIMEALYPGTVNLTPILGFSQYVAECSEPLGLAFQDAPFGISPHQDNFSEDDFLNYFAHYDDDFMSGVFALPGAESSIQVVQRRSVEDYRTQPTGAEPPSLRDLQGSAVIIQLKQFLEECGELPQILSGRGATTKYANCLINQLTPRVDDHVETCIQRMRQTELSRDTSFSAILSVVNKFIQLGYLQTNEGVQEYMLIVGKETMPDRHFVSYCRLVVNTFGMASLSMSRSQPVASSDLKKFPCSVCQRMFSRRNNMQRHMTRVHRQHIRDFREEVASSGLWVA